MYFVVLDIETSEVGHPTDFGFFDGENFSHFFTVSDAVSYILELPACSIYAHYGMGFDFAIIYRELVGRVKELNIALSGSAGIFIGFKNNKNSYWLLDSFRLMPSGLAALSKQFGTEIKKQNLFGLMAWDLTSDDRISYLKDDCISLYQVIQKFWLTIDQSFGMTHKGVPFRSKTLASLSLKIFIDKYVPKRKVFNPCKLQADDEQRSYFGGLVYVNAEHSVLLDDITIYDVNSMYPYIMSIYKFPYSYHRSKVRKFMPREVGLWECQYECFVGIPFIFDTVSRTLSYSGHAIIDTDTYQYLLDIGAKVTLIQGHIYERTSYFFKEFVTDCYRLRQEFGKDSALGYTAKILMNSLYGKFGEKDIKRTMSTKEKKGVKNIIHSTSGVVSTEIFDYEEVKYIQHRFPAIASFVTLRSRLFLKKVIDLQENFLYCDTDSIHLQGNAISIPEGPELGKFKKEFQGSAVYKGKKAYQLYNNDGSVYKTVLKGIPASARNCIDFREIKGGDSISINYDSYSSINKLIRGSHKTFKRSTLVRSFRKVDSRIQ